MPQIPASGDVGSSPAGSLRPLSRLLGGCLFPEDPASFQRSRVPFPVANLNHTRTRVYKHISAELNQGFPSEIKMAMWFFRIWPGLGPGLLPWAWKGLAGAGSEEMRQPAGAPKGEGPAALPPALPLPPLSSPLPRAATSESLSDWKL